MPSRRSRPRRHRRPRRRAQPTAPGHARRRTNTTTAPRRGHAPAARAKHDSGVIWSCRCSPGARRVGHAARTVARAAPRTLGSRPGPRGRCRTARRQETAMAPSDPRQTKFVLDESRIPRAWYNIAADLPVAALPAAPPGHRPADRAGRPRPAVPDGAHRPGGLGRARDRDPRTGPRRLPAVPAEPALPRPSAGARARYAGPHLLQVRGRAARPAATSRTPRSRRPSTTRRRASSGWRPRRAPGSGGARWPSPGAFFGLEVKVYMVRASYDQKPYRRILMETYGAEVVASPSLTTNYGRAVLGRDARQPGLAGDGHQRGGRGRGDARRHQVRPRLGPQPRAAAPDGHRPGGASSRWGWPASRRTSSSAAPAAARTSPA